MLYDKVGLSNPFQSPPRTADVSNIHGIIFHLSLGLSLVKVGVAKLTSPMPSIKSKGTIDGVPCGRCHMTPPRNSWHTADEIFVSPSSMDGYVQYPCTCRLFKHVLYIQPASLQVASSFPDKSVSQFFFLPQKQKFANPEQKNQVLKVQVRNTRWQNICNLGLRW